MMKTNSKIVDLHVHSTRSDGSMTPSGLVEYAIQKGLSAFALTDHDTTAGVEEAILAAKSNLSHHSLEVIPGIELSTEYLGRDIHILGLYLPYQNQTFQDRLSNFLDSRTSRNLKMCSLLTQQGIPIDYPSLQNTFPDSVITRAHFAEYLLQKGQIKSRNEAFERYIGDFGPCFVPREKITPAQAISLILEFGGIPILAHPLLYSLGKEKLDALVALLAQSGLVGLEAVYSTYNPSEEREMRALAGKHSLAISGGSDFHGTAKPGLDLATGYGRLYIPDSILETLITTSKQKRTNIS